MTNNNSNKLVLTVAEKEIIVFKAAWFAIGEMVNNARMTICHNDPDSSVRHNTDLDLKYFSIILWDFLSFKIFGVSESCIDALDTVLKKSIFNSSNQNLKDLIQELKKWLEEDVKLENNRETKKFWFPSIDKDISLQIKRIEFIQICSNISKHNMLCLDGQANKILEIFKRNNVNIELTQALLIMEEFYEQFHNDIFIYHSSTIAEFLNNLRWEIYEYLKPLYQSSVEYYPGKYFPDQKAYKYNYPENIKNEYAKEIFWNLMNDVRSEPYIKRFKVSRYLKMRY